MGDGGEIMSEYPDGPRPGLPRGAARALAVLELLAARPDGLGASAIARRCAIPRSSAHQLISALAGAGYVTREGRRWVLGGRAARLALERPPTDEMLRVVEAFDRGSATLSAGEIALRSELELARAQSALRELSRVRLVESDGAGRHRLGLRWAATAARIVPVETLRAAARPHLVRLRDRTGESASILLQDEDRALYLEQVESRHALRHTGWAGRSIPLVGTAAGLALRHPGTCQVVQDAVEIGVTAVAHAVADPYGRVAVSVVGPSARIGGGRLPTIRLAVREAARDLARALVDQDVSPAGHLSRGAT